MADAGKRSGRKAPAWDWKIVLALLAALLTVMLAGCEIVDSLTPAAIEPPGQSIIRESPAPTAAPTAAPTSAPTPAPLPVALDLKIAPTPDNLPEFNRRDWKHWRDVDGDCQDARQETLIAESTVPVTFKTGKQCRVASGRWVGPYTGTVVEDPGKLDIDHMVPLSNAHKSGAWQWDQERKAAFANDLDYAGHLIAATAGANRSKGASGPEDWRPPDQSYWCQYATDWTAIKGRWGLTVTQPEFDALQEMLQTCDGVTAIKSDTRQADTPRSAP